jgi:hypothetical protein
MEKMGEQDRAIALKHLARMRGLSNTEKNYRGKLIGLKRLNLVDKKRNEEKALQEFIEANAQRKEKYGNLLNEIGKIYGQMRDEADKELLLTYLLRSCNMLNYAYIVYEATIERKKKDIERESAYMDRNFSRTKERLFLNVKDYYEPTDKIIFKEMLMRAAKLPSGQRIPAIEDIINSKPDPEHAIDGFIEHAYAQSKLSNEKVLKDGLKKSASNIKKMDDPFIKLAVKLYPTYQERKEASKARRGAIDKLYAQLIDVKKDFLARDFIPDANGTLRLTFGYIRGYRPKDAVYCAPITTAQGVLEKTTGNEPFDSPQKLIELIKARDYGQFQHPKLKSVPVAILYNMDTTGGNSGSPILNARGELVGINFDRAFEATVNDFAWSEDYSRSIAVDIRYVLWITQKFGGAEYLLEEMQVLEE